MDSRVDDKEQKMVGLGPLIEPAAGICEDGLAFGKSFVGICIPTTSPSLSLPPISFL